MNASLYAGCSLAKEVSQDRDAVDEAFTKLAAEDLANAELVKLRLFAGLTMPEIARMLKVSLATACRRWTYARTWLCVLVEDRGQSKKNLRIPSKGMRGFASVCRIDDSKVNALS